MDDLHDHENNSVCLTIIRTDCGTRKFLIGCMPSNMVISDMGIVMNFVVLKASIMDPPQLIL